MDILGRTGLGGYSEEKLVEATTKDANIYRVRSLRERLNDKIAYHKSEIEKIQNVIDALSPDVERALDALAKLRRSLV